MTAPLSVDCTVVASDDDSDTVLTTPPETVFDTVAGMVTGGRTVPAAMGSAPV